MWFPTPSIESLTRPRVAVAIVSAVAAVSVGYYAYHQGSPDLPETVTGPGLHRSNAVRHPRRSQRRGTASSSSSEPAGDENDYTHNTAQPLGDGETVVDDAAADEWWEPGHLPASQRAGHNIVNLLFRVSEDNARRNGCVHRGCLCNSCGMVPIRGIRYRCANCADFDLCETCESQGLHTKTHVFYKIRVPAPPFASRQMQPVWYTGDPDTCRRTLPKALITRLSKESGFERPELEAFWEQWTFMANTEWRDDPDELYLALDRKTFERCLVPTGGSRHAAPNLIHDRMFAFYDRNRDGLIGFSEFIEGQSYRKSPDKLRKVFEGYDLDGDGYVTRKDFLRMFRAYYVLYKQMHKDILEGLEDQLLASTEAQQLVASSRQPLSSFFGRDGAIPHGDRTLRLDGKTLNRDGSVDIAEGTNVVASDRSDTVGRGDILTSLFAYAAEPRPRPWRFVTSATNHSEDYDQPLRGITDADRPYLVTLIDPPMTLDDLPDAIMGNHTLDIDEDDDVEREDSDEDEEDDGDDMGDANGNTSSSGATHSEAEQRIRALSYTRRRIPRLERRRRDMAREQLHNRWKRRQFYLDEEEGGEAPDDWQDNEDIFLQDQEGGESSKSAGQDLNFSRSRSNSKVRFVDELEELETRSNPSTSSRSVPDRWGTMEVPDFEKDAGKEILYQVTQQAFNELLDTIFKQAEDIAVEARETKELREKYRAAIESYVSPTDKMGEEAADQDEAALNPEQPTPKNEVPPSEKTLTQLLSESGYSVIDEAEPRNAVDLDSAPEPTRGEKEADSADSDRDLTMPQFRPETMTWADAYRDSKARYYPITRSSPPPSEASDDFEPTYTMLGHWKDLNKAEKQAAERGGWAKLNFKEFESIYRSQEYQGNRLDYLGSWIDFCIP
ncbi:hypothetical protein ACO1O0_003961 [Amphichorda felina]